MADAIPVNSTKKTANKKTPNGVSEDVLEAVKDEAVVETTSKEVQLTSHKAIRKDN